MLLKIEISERDLKDLIVKEFKEKLGNVEFTESNVVILVKSKQNYKAEWEAANFKASLEIFTIN